MGNLDHGFWQVPSALHSMLKQQNGAESHGAPGSAQVSSVKQAPPTQTPTAQSRSHVQKGPSSSGPMVSPSVH